MQLAGTKQGIRFPMCRNLSSCTGEIYIIIPTQYPPSKEKVMYVEMAYCTNCGKEIASTSKFCSTCGKENAEYNPNGNKSSQEYDVIVTPKIRLAGPQDAKTETYVFVTQLGKNMRILFPNFMNSVKLFESAAKVCISRMGTEEISLLHRLKSNTTTQK